MRNALLPLLVVLAGCGGAGGGDTSFIEGNAGSVSVSFAAGSGYNGGAAPINAYSRLDGSAAGKVVTISATANDRGVEVVLVASKAVTGSTVDLSTSGGSDVVYSDAVGKWGATSGTLTVTSRTSTGVQLTLTNVVLKNSSGGALGTVTLNGTLSFVARTT